MLGLVQHIANEFWSHWNKEYLQSLQEHQRMECPKKKFCYWWYCATETIDVLRNKWLVARVTVTKRNHNGFVWSVYLKIGDQPGREKAKNIVEQTADKIALLLKSGMFDWHQGTNWCFVINSVILREAIWNCTLMKYSSKQWTRWRNVFVKKC